MTSRKEINETSEFLAFAVCSRCSYGTGCRDFEAINPYYDFVCFQTKWASNPPSHTKPITFGNELQTYDMYDV